MIPLPLLRWLVGLAVVVGAGLAVNHHGVQAGRAQIQASWDAERATLASAAAAESERERTI